ncbi:MAG: right-handed parallel beta-helix repeat-containing protein [Myxococcota bacterium]
MWSTACVDTTGDILRVGTVQTPTESPSDPDPTGGGGDLPATPLTVTAPNGGELVFAGSSATIRWTTETGTSPVNVFVSTNSGVSWELVAPFLPASGEFDWFVDSTPTTEARVRVASADGTLEDQSDSSFEIALGTIEVSSPVAGTTFTPGANQDIQWQTTNFNGLVNIAYSADGELTFVPIAWAEPNDGSFAWTVPDAASSQVTVRVAASQAGPSGSSGVFSIQGSDTVWYVRASSTGGDGTSWFNAFIDLGSALNAARAGDEVWVAEGLYAEPVTIPAGVSVYGGFQGIDTETERFQRNPGAQRPVLNGIDTPQVVTMGSNTVLDGFEITRGLSMDAAGGMLVDTQTDVTLRDVRFIANRAENSGGALEAIASTIHIDGCVFDTNDSGAGAVTFRGGTATIQDSLFDSNESTNFLLAGALYVLDGADVTVERSTFARNIGHIGGVLHMTGGTVRFSDSEFYDNRSGASGAIADFFGDSELVMENSVVAFNTAGSGTGMLYHLSGAVTVRNTIFHRNRNGAEPMLNYDGGTTTVSHSILQDTREIVDAGGNVLVPATFVDEGGRDFRPSQASSAIDAGDDVNATPSDRLGRSRRDDPGTSNGPAGISDIGPYEFQGVTQLHVTSPNGGEAWPAQSTQAVTWRAAAIDFLILEFSSDGGDTYTPLLTDLDAGLGQATFTVPDEGSPNALVRLRSTDSILSDTSDLPFAVTSTDALYVDASATGMSTGLTWEDAYTTLGPALADADFGATINVAEGTYRATVATSALVPLPPGVTLLGGYPAGGGLRAPASHVTTLDGNALAAHVVTTSGGGVVDGFHIINSAGVLQGGGVYLTGGDFTLANSYVSGNSATEGAGLFGHQPPGTLRINNSIIESNTGGNQVHVEDDVSLVMTDTTVRMGTNGCVLKGSGGQLTILGGTLTNCGASPAVSIGQSTVGPNTITGTLIADNVTSSSSLRAGISVGTDTDLTVRNVVFRNNSAGDSPAIGGFGGTLLRIENCVFDGNRTTGSSSRRKVIDIGSFVTVEIVNSTFFTEEDIQLVGARFRSTFTNTVNVVNSVLWGSPAAVAFEPDIVSLSVSYSTVIGGATGPGNASNDPLFVDAPGGDLSLQSASPGIDSGNGDLAPVFDALGNPRVDQPVSDTGIGTPTYVDRGAFERQ